MGGSIIFASCCDVRLEHLHSQVAAMPPPPDQKPTDQSEPGMEQQSPPPRPPLPASKASSQCFGPDSVFLLGSC